MFGHATIANSPSGWLDKAERDNPILRLSWHFIGDSPEQASAYQEARNNLINNLGHGLDAGSASFYELCTSSLMNQTFWSHDAFSLFWPLLRIETMEIVDQTPDEKAAANIIQFDRMAYPNMSLQEAVDNNFGGPEGDSGIVYRPNRPLLIRILYRTDGGPDHSGNYLKFHDLRQFSLPSWVQTDEFEFDLEGPSCIYTITAVVRMRTSDEAEGRDCVRTYAHNGPNIVAAYEDANLMPSGWSVTDIAPDREYMLIYAPISHDQTTDLSSLPEYSPASRFDVGVWKTTSRLFDPRIAQIRRKRAEEAQNISQQKADERVDKNTGDLIGEDTSRS
ncbi:hypothetical protein ACHAPQ_004241 [Fusarium lateritium]